MESFINPNSIRMLKSNKNSFHKILYKNLPFAKSTSLIVSNISVVFLSPQSLVLSPQPFVLCPQFLVHSPQSIVLSPYPQYLVISIQSIFTISHSLVPIIGFYLLNLSLLICLEPIEKCAVVRGCLLVVVQNRIRVQFRLKLNQVE